MKGEHLTQSEDIAPSEEAGELYRGILASAQTGIYIVQDGKFQYVNPQFEEYTGYKNEELMGRYSLELVHPDDREMVRREAIRRLKGEEDSPYEYRFIAKDGSVEWTMERVASVTYQGKQAAIGSFMDITERKNAEYGLVKQRRSLANIMATIPDSLLVLDKELRIKRANRSFYEMFRTEPEKILGKKISEVLPDREGKIADRLAKLLRTEDTVEKFEITYRSEQVGEKILSLTARGIIVAEEEEELLVVLQDITERKWAKKEVNVAYDALNSSVNGVIITDTEGMISYCNPAFLQMFEYKNRDEVTGKYAKDLFATEKVQKFSDVSAIIDHKKGETEEFSVRRKDGTEFPVEVSSSIVTDEGGNSVGRMASFIDITNRKQMEEALIASKAYTESIIQNFLDTLIVVDTQAKIQTVNPATCRLLGYKEEELIGQPVSIIFAEEEEEEVHRVFQFFRGAEKARSLRPQDTIRNCELTYKTKDGQLIPMSFNASLLTDEAGNVTGVVAGAKDITELKLAEKEIREEKNFSENVIATVPDSLVVLDKDLRIKSANRSFYKMFQMEAEEVIGTHVTEILPDKDGKLSAELSKLFGTEDMLENFELHYKSEKLGERVFNITARGMLIAEEEEEEEEELLVLEDITDRKRAEKMLKESEEKYKSLVSNIKLGIFRSTPEPEGKFLEVNPAIEVITGYSREELLQMNVADLYVYSEEREAVFREIAATQGGIVKEVEFKKKDGTEIVVAETKVPVRDEKGEILYFDGILEDITERKLVEILNSEMKIQDIFEVFVQRLRKIASVDYASIALAEGDKLRILSLSARIKSVREPGELIPLEGTTTEQVIKNRKTIYEANLEKEGRFWTAERYIREGIRSIVHLPLIVEERAIGSLIIASQLPGAYNPEQIKFLERVASQAATPIENVRLYAKMEEMACTDELTGLFNRRHFGERFKEELARAQRYDEEFYLLTLDLDDFKFYNDAFGHSFGDEILQQVGGILKSAIRSADQFFRYGGDEFAAILPETNADGARKVAERVGEQVAAAMRERQIDITCSIGLAGYPFDGVNFDELVSAADAALYYAKYTGGNRICSPSAILTETKEEMKKKGLTTDISSIVQALLSAVNAKDYYTYEHSQKVKSWAVALAENIGLSAEEIADISTAALLHDIGKIGIPNKILNKEGKLDEEEWRVIKSHSRSGVNILANVNSLASCISAVLHHHERWDGNGYPEGLKGEEIPLHARILGIADAYAAMTSARPYRAALTPEKVIEEFKKGVGTQFDPQLVKTFLKLIEASSSEEEKE